MDHLQVLVQIVIVLEEMLERTQVLVVVPDVMVAEILPIVVVKVEVVL